MVKLHQPHEYPTICDDSSDEISQVEALSKFRPLGVKRSKEKDVFQSSFRELRSKKRKAMATSINPAVVETPYKFPTF